MDLLERLLDFIINIVNTHLTSYLRFNPVCIVILVIVLILIISALFIYRNYPTKKNYAFIIFGFAILIFICIFITSALPARIEDIQVIENPPFYCGDQITIKVKAKSYPWDRTYFRYFVYDGRKRIEITQYPGRGNWTPNEECRWITAGYSKGDYIIEVNAQDSFFSEFDMDFVEDSKQLETPIKLNENNIAPTTADLYLQPPDELYAGETLRIIVIADDKENDTLFYKYTIKDLNSDGVDIITDWISTFQYNWSTSNSDLGPHQILVQIKDGMHNETGDIELIRNFTIKEAENPCICRFWPNLSSPQIQGITVRWTVEPCSEDDSHSYQFLLKGPSTDNQWDIKQPWNRRNYWDWETSKEDVGDNHIMVQLLYNDLIKDNMTKSYKIIDVINHPPEITSLYPDKESPQEVGIEIIWTARTRDDDGDRIYYKYFLQGPATNGLWEEMTGWTDNPRWQWNPTSKDIGMNQIMVKVKDENGLEVNKSEEFYIKPNTEFFAEEMPEGSALISGSAEDLKQPYDGRVNTVRFESSSDYIIYKFYVGNVLLDCDKINLKFIGNISVGSLYSPELKISIKDKNNNWVYFASVLRDRLTEHIELGDYRKYVNNNYIKIKYEIIPSSGDPNRYTASIDYQSLILECD